MRNMSISPSTRMSLSPVSDPRHRAWPESAGSVNPAACCGTCRERRRESFLSRIEDTRSLLRGGSMPLPTATRSCPRPGLHAPGGHDRDGDPGHHAGYRLPVAVPEHLDGADSRFLTTASLLAQGRMAEIDAADPRGVVSGNGDFGEDFPGYTWRLEVSDVEESRSSRGSRSR